MNIPNATELAATIKCEKITPREAFAGARMASREEHNWLRIPEGKDLLVGVSSQLDLAEL